MTKIDRIKEVTMPLKIYSIESPWGTIWICKHPQFGRAEFWKERDAIEFGRNGTIRNNVKYNVGKLPRNPMEAE